MAIYTNHPVIDEEDPENPYDKLLINLAISASVKNNVIGASVAMSMTPFRIKEDVVESKPEYRRSVSILDAYKKAETDPELAVCLITIQTALDNYIQAKGL